MQKVWPSCRCCQCAQQIHCAPCLPPYASASCQVNTAAGFTVGQRVRIYVNDVSTTSESQILPCCLRVFCVWLLLIAPPSWPLCWP